MREFSDFERELIARDFIQRDIKDFDGLYYEWYCMTGYGAVTVSEDDRTNRVDVKLDNCGEISLSIRPNTKDLDFFLEKAYEVLSNRFGLE